MEKNQYELCVEVLRRLDKAGVLKHLVLIGSWCVPFYSDYFKSPKYLPSIKTRDIDFLIPIPLRTNINADIPEILKDLGFIIGFKGSQGYIKLEHPQLVVEFLVPERGRGLDKPFPLPQFGINAQTLRFLDFLTINTIRVQAENLLINLPHPANFALHKLIIFQRRVNVEKIEKDRAAAIKILKALLDKNEASIIKNVFRSVPQKWQIKIIKGLKEAREEKIMDVLINMAQDENK